MLVHAGVQQIGFDECVSRLYEMVAKAKQNAGIAATCPLDSLVSDHARYEK